MPDRPHDIAELVHGVIVYDELTDRRGTIADSTTSPGLVFLRPIGGGIEWQARREYIRPVLASELLADRLHNTRTTNYGGGTS